MTTRSETRSAVVGGVDQGKLRLPNGARAQKTKKARLVALLRRKGGASLASLQNELGWQPHTVGAAISGVRKAGETVECAKGKSGPVYRIVKSEVAQ